MSTDRVLHGEGYDGQLLFVPEPWFKSCRDYIAAFSAISRAERWSDIPEDITGSSAFKALVDGFVTGWYEDDEDGGGDGRPEDSQLLTDMQVTLDVVVDSVPMLDDVDALRDFPQSVLDCARHALVSPMTGYTPVDFDADKGPEVRRLLEDAGFEVVDAFEEFNAYHQAWAT